MNLKNYFSLFFLILLYMGPLRAQVPPTIEWEDNFGGSGIDRAESIRATSDGGYVVAGWTESNDGDVSQNNGLRDVWVVKLDATGAMLWEKTYGGSGAEEAYDIRQTTDGGYIVAGYTSSTDGDVSQNNGNYDFWVLKLDALGNLVWEDAYGGSLSEVALAIQQTTDGGYIVAGYSSSGNGDVGQYLGGGEDAWVIKLNSTGGLVWEETYGGGNK